MLAKLLKYDLKYMIKRMIVFYILSIFFAIATRIIFSLNQTIFMVILGKVTVSVMYTMLANVVFNTLIISLIRFNDSIYKDESYLTHTLPVTKGQIYESRFLQALIFTIIGFIVIVISVFITYYSKENWLLVRGIIDSIADGFDFNGGLIIASFIVIFFLEIFNVLQCGFFGLIIGNKFNNAKIGYAFLFGFIAYNLSQAVVVLFTIIVGLFNKDIMSIFTSSVIMNINIIKILIVILIISYILVIGVTNLICVKELNKGVNV